jgi:hypothetical protein
MVWYGLIILKLTKVIHFKSNPDIYGYIDFHNLCSFIYQKSTNTLVLLPNLFYLLSYQFDYSIPAV